MLHRRGKSRSNQIIALLLSLMLVISLFPMVPRAQAAPGINQQIPFYGTLKDSSGTELTGTFDMVFRFYDAGTGGTLLDTSTHTTANGNPITVSAGEFEALLGSGAGNVLDGIDFNDDTIFVGLTIGTDSEMTPRTRLGAAAYAFNADTVDGLDASAFQLAASSTNFLDSTDPEIEITSINPVPIGVWDGGAGVTFTNGFSVYECTMIWLFFLIAAVNLVYESKFIATNVAASLIDVSSVVVMLSTSSSPEEP